MEEETKTWIVGPEYDQSIFDRLGLTLRDLGYTKSTESWGVAGSQELSRWCVDGPSGQLVVEAETYIGLQVIGPISLIEKLQKRYIAISRSS